MARTERRVQNSFARDSEAGAEQTRAGTREDTKQRMQQKTKQKRLQKINASELVCLAMIDALSTYCT